MIPGILLALILIGLLISLGLKNALPLQIGLIIIGLLCAVWYLKSRPGPVTSIEMDLNRQQAIGYTLTREALQGLADGDELLVLTTSFPAWKNTSESMVEGINQAMAERRGVNSRTLDITTLGEFGDRVDADLSQVLKAVASEVKGVDAIVTAFIGMGDFRTPVPKLPPVYAFYDGRSNGWQFLIRKKRLRGVAVRMLWREDPPGRELHPLEELFRQEYLYVNADNVAELAPVPVRSR